MSTEARQRETVTMKAIVRDEYGTPDVLQFEDIAKPIPGDGEVLVSVIASSVNPAQWHRLTGLPYLARLDNGIRKPKRRQLGSDLAGRVTAIGPGVSEFRVGDEVFGLGPGTYAEFTAVAADALVHKPAGLTFAEAGSVGVAALTALQGLRKGKIKSGHRVLINGASGGVGTFAVQIAKAHGAHVTAVCSSRHVETVKSIGADRIIDYTQEDFVAGGDRFDLVLDNVGNRSVLDLRSVLAPDGIYVAVSGPKKSAIIVGRMLLMVALSLVGGRKMRTLLSSNNGADLATLRDFLESGEVRPVIDRRYALAEVPDALRYQGEGHGQGKTVILVDPTAEEV